ncbi:hypothetical protein OCGS_1957 [Oceaniovalibus guishaninsula JLT2003]|uniref:Uncharacterized protein n=1 Tax=Oceaniovalibus guishaninsula JLT2003 TaxID=1231392 RepID=K2GML7_9RHOB|nr:VPLPA-CTERM sorting domain-containing protein [Oceaniovalibus guishaninsula]EKE43976.1 hypothetical protein OCGS_1957 [Oceaniovalibus guishaninsula JLT2003]
MKQAIIIAAAALSVLLTAGMGAAANVTFLPEVFTPPPDAQPFDATLHVGGRVEVGRPSGDEHPTDAPGGDAGSGRPGLTGGSPAEFLLTSSQRDDSPDTLRLTSSWSDQARKPDPLNLTSDNPGDAAPAVDVPAVPLPAGGVLLIAGLAAFGAVGRRGKASRRP